MAQKSNVDEHIPYLYLEAAVAPVSVRGHFAPPLKDRHGILVVKSAPLLTV
jgi:hypothetical protein